MGVFDNAKSALARLGKPSPQPSMTLNVEPLPLRTDPNEANMFLGLRPNTNPVLRYNRTQAGVGYQTYSGMLRQMPAHNGRLFGLINQFKSGVIERNMYWRNFDTSPRAQLAASFIKQADTVLERSSAEFGGLYGDMCQALDVFLYGPQLFQLIYDRVSFPLKTSETQRQHSREWTVIVDAKQVPMERIGFDRDGLVCVNARMTDAEAAERGFNGTVKGEANWWYPHPMAFAYLNQYSVADDPWGGQPALASAWVCQWLFRNVRVFHSNFIERNTSPPLKVEQEQWTQFDSVQLAAVIEATKDIQQGSQLMFPPGMRAEFMELLSNASPQAIENFLRNCEYETAAAILGQTSSSMSERSGSMSSSEVQERAGNNIIKMHALMLQTFRNQLAHRMLGYNMPDYQDVWPEFRIQTESAEDMLKRMQAVQIYVELGGKFTQRQAAFEIGADEPLPGEDVLEMAVAPTDPSQTAPGKAMQKQGERDAAKPTSSQVQPKR